MVDNVIEGVLGGEPEDESGAGGAALDPFSGADALASALAVESAETDSGARADAVAYLQSQKALVDLQVRYFEVQRRLARDERLLAIDAAKRKRFADRLKNVVQLLVTVGTGLVALALAVVLGQAVLSRSVVVEPFSTPPALAPRGVSGQVVASGVLDQLRLLQDVTRSTAKTLQARDAWSSDIRFEVPQTGMSVGEIEGLLRRRLGHDVHISGDLVQTSSGGLALTVRGDSVPARTFDGGAEDLPKLTREAAEYIYGRSEPVEFATYLASDNRYADAIAFIPGALARARDDESRFRLANLWGSAYTGLNRPAEAVAKFRLALAIKPGDWRAWSNLIGPLPLVSGEEAAWREAKRLLRDAEKARGAKKPELRLLQNPAAEVWDLPLLLAAFRDDATHNAGAGANANIAGPEVADVLGLMHDPIGAARELAGGDPADPTTKAEANLLPAYAALDAGEASAAVGPLAAYWSAWLADPDLQFVAPDTPCLYGEALGLTGRLAQAEAVFARTGRWSRCYAAHGDALARAGDVAGAQRVWSEGARITPDLPFIYLHRGVWEMARGDFVAASTDFAAAHARAPHFADPLKADGDRLMRQGRWRQALAAYDDALKYAPGWAELRQAQAAAAARVKGPGAPD